MPPLISERVAFYDKARNAFFEHSDAQMFIARRDGKPVGTIVAILNNRHNEFHNETTGFFGGFECINDASVAHKLLGTAREWVKARGMTVLRGPCTLSFNDEVGLLVDGFDGEPQVLMTYNPRYYQPLIESYGFKKAMDLWAWWTSTKGAIKNVKVRLERLEKLVMKRGRFTIRTVDFKQLPREVEVLKKIYTSDQGAWRENWGHVPMTDHEINHLVANLKQFADPEFIFIAEHDGVPVAISATLPNVNRPLHKDYPKPHTPELWTLAKFVWYRRSMVNAVRFIILGVLPEHRMSGIDAVLILKSLETADRKGYIGAELSWILETNEAMNRVNALSGGTVYRTYRVYDLPIG